MNIQTTDAWGRDTRNLGTCARCGQTISNIYTYRGKTYGADCIEVVTGERVDRWVVWNGQIDEAATAERKAKREARQAEMAAYTAKVEADRKMKTARLIEIQGFLIEFLNAQNGDFCQNMANLLKQDNFFDLSPRQREVIEKIYAKGNGARYNSKRYWTLIQGIYDQLGYCPIDAAIWFAE